MIQSSNNKNNSLEGHTGLQTIFFLGAGQVVYWEKNQQK